MRWSLVSRHRVCWPVIAAITRRWWHRWERCRRLWRSLRLIDWFPIHEVWIINLPRWEGADPGFKVKPIVKGEATFDALVDPVGSAWVLIFQVEPCLQIIQHFSVFFSVFIPEKWNHLPNRVWCEFVYYSATLPIWWSWRKLNPCIQCSLFSGQGMLTSEVNLSFFLSPPPPLTFFSFSFF